MARIPHCQSQPTLAANSCYTLIGAENDRAARSQSGFSVLLLDDPEVFSFDGVYHASAQAPARSSDGARGRRTAATTKVERVLGSEVLPVIRFANGGGLDIDIDMDMDMDMDLDLDLNMDMDFFELGGVPVSPLSPSLAQRGGSPVGGRGRMNR